MYGIYDVIVCGVRSPTVLAQRLGVLACRAGLCRAGLGSDEMRRDGMGGWRRKRLEVQYVTAHLRRDRGSPYRPGGGGEEGDFPNPQQ